MQLRYFHIVLSISLVLMFSSTKAQNLVRNGGFEDYKTCPVKMSNLNKDAEHWSAPTLGTTDYFNECSRTKLGIPMNFKGKQEAFEGTAYAGMYLYAPKDYREYIQVPLTETLQKGHRYRLRLVMSLSEKSDGAVMDMGAVFAEKPLSIHTKRQLSHRALTSQIVQTTHIKQFSAPHFYDDRQDWTELTMDIVAKGFETHLILGNFMSNAATHYLDFKNNDSNAEGYAYYYLDDISLTYLGPEYQPNEVYVLDHVNFKFDRFDLQPKAKQSLQDVFEYLKKHPNLKVSISGHTDDLGSDSYNDVLSKERASSVAKYLLGLGLEKNRISYKGYGDKVPLDTTLTDQARRRNRRVEFVMTEFVDE
ncbi:OmpA family protein [Flagellimonas olearia]|uniref:OmpA family protein n=1 Tax=Flagellimonas olearia TaxID=552546 RepID=A0A6I1E2G9_9FLAO|nr:OmpA family protein [Allomuricauda olearia]KAB7531437.1 OmpA family protein [Allomuricauda olearia]